MEHEEIEVKYHLPDMADLRQRLIAAGATSSGRVRETNIRFDDSQNSIKNRQALLRLRQDVKNTLTFKCRPEKDDNRFKIFREIETGVDDFDATRRILEALGYFPQQTYEKYRETFILNKTTLCLDTMPYGDFLEIEGEKNRIRELSDQLGLNWRKRILATYLELFEYIKQAASLEFNDLTFANFQGIKDDFPADWKRFEHGAD